MTGSTIAPGWYQLPNDPPDMMRYWNGAHWSDPHLLPADAQPHAETTTTPAGIFSPSSTPQDFGVDRVSRPRLNITGPASVGKRVGARVVDGVIQWVLYLLLLLPSDSVSVGHRGFLVQLPGWSSASAIWAIIMGILVFAVWEFFWVAQRGATPGKMVFQLAVAEQPGQNVPPTSQAAATRVAHRVLYGVPILGLIVWLCEIAAAAYFMFGPKSTDERATLPDQFTSTRVVAVAPGSPVQLIDRRLGATVAAAAVSVALLAYGMWYFAHRPALAEADAVVSDIQNNLAEATSAFASSCGVDRQRYADYFTRNQILDFELDQATIDWAVPFFSGDDERTEAVVTGSAVVTGEIEGAQRVNLLLIRDSGWKVCRFLGE